MPTETKQILFYIAIGIAIYFLFFRKSEGFGGAAVKSQCQYLKGQQNQVHDMYKKKCDSVDVNKDSRSGINERAECYNYAGDAIVTDLDVNSWCEDIDPSDLALIDEATKTLDKPVTDGLDAYNTDSGYADF